MRRIDTTNRAINLFGAGKHGWKNGVPGTSDRPTEGRADWFNAVQEEMAGAVEASGQTLDPESYAQLSEAIRVLGRTRMYPRTAEEIANDVTPTDYSREPGDLRRYGGDPSAGADASAALLAATKVGKVICDDKCSFLIAHQVTLLNGDIEFIGRGTGTLVRGATIDGATSDIVSVIAANGRTGLKFRGLRFRVQAGTPHSQLGYFCYLPLCHGVDARACVFDSAIPGASTAKESLAGHFFTPSCNSLRVIGNESYSSYGNAFGAHGDGVAGTNGHDAIIGYNLIKNAMDTGIGLWTGTRGAQVIGNTIVRDDYDTDYNSVGVDVAGCYSGVVQSNTINGGVIGIRYLTNLIYTNRATKLAKNIIFNQVPGNSGEPPTAIKVDHNNGTLLTSQHMDLSMIGNEIKVSASGIGVNLISTVTDTAYALTVKVDDNTFDMSAAGCSCITVQGDGGGRIDAQPGSNTYLGSGAGSVVASFVSNGARNVISQELKAVHKSDFQVTNALLNVGSTHCSRGVYALVASLGACSNGDGTGSVLYLRTKAGAALPSNKVINAGVANTSFSDCWNAVTTPGPHRVTIEPTGTTMNNNHDYVSLIRVF